MTNILTAIGSSVSDDPTTAGNTGIIKPIDILCLQESDGWATTGQSYASYSIAFIRRKLSGRPSGWQFDRSAQKHGVDGL